MSHLPVNPLRTLKLAPVGFFFFFCIVLWRCANGNESMISLCTQLTDSPQQQVGLGKLDTRENHTISYIRLLLDQLLAATMNFFKQDLVWSEGTENSLRATDGSWMLESHWSDLSFWFPLTVFCWNLIYFFWFWPI